MIEYILGDVGESDEQKTISMTETKDVTVIEKTSIGQLKQEHANILNEIEVLNIRADAIVDKINTINTEITEITVKDIPIKLTESVITK